MDVFSGIKNVANTAAFLANTTNAVTGFKNDIDAVTAIDETKRKLANDRKLCLAKFQLRNLKTIGLFIFAPLFVLFLLFAIPTAYYKVTHPDDPQMKNKKDNMYINISGIVIFLCVMFGSAPYIGYLSNVKWPYEEYNINLSKKITAETCSQYYE